MSLVRLLGPRLRPFLERLADPIIRDALGERRQAVVVARAEVNDLQRPLRALERHADSVAARFDRTPVGPEMTVHAAHARDPRVQALFVQRGLPNCPACPVGADETLAEAAFAEGFGVGELLAEMAGELA